MLLCSVPFITFASLSFCKRVRSTIIVNNSCRLIVREYLPFDYAFSSSVKKASISRNGSEVTVDCAVAAGYPEASCVLVYREYGNSTLTVRDFPLLPVFSIKLPVNTPDNYTFAIFGKNGDSEIEEKPAFIVKFKTPSSGQCICSVNAVYLSQACKVL